MSERERESGKKGGRERLNAYVYAKTPMQWNVWACLIKYFLEIVNLESKLLLSKLVVPTHKRTKE